GVLPIPVGPAIALLEDDLAAFGYEHAAVKAAVLVVQADQLFDLRRFVARGACASVIQLRKSAATSDCADRNGDHNLEKRARFGFHGVPRLGLSVPCNKCFTSRVRLKHPYVNQRL